MGLRSMSSSEDAVISVGTVRRVARRAGKKEQMKIIAGERGNGKGEEEGEKEEKRNKIT